MRTSIIYHLRILGGSVVKNLPIMQETACNIGDTGTTLGLGRYSGEVSYQV